MERPTREGAGRWMPAGLLGMLTLLLVVESTVARHDLDWMAPWHWDWRLTGRAAGKQARRAEILVLGDSLAKFGVLPRVIEALTNRRAYNLAICLGQAPSSYFLLKRALNAGARPTAIVVNFTPHFLGPGPRLAQRLWPELLDTAETFDLARTAGDADLFTSITIARMLPTVRDRAEIRAALMASLRGRPRTMRHEAPRFWRNWRVNHGANLMPPIPLRGKLEDWGPRLFPAWACDPINERYLRRFFELAAAAKVPVYWLLPPITPAVQAQCERIGYDAQHLEFVREWQARSPNVIVLDARHAEYPQAAHTDDPLHLNRRGAAVLSADIAARLGGGGGRWIELPRYRDRPTNVPLEDIEESRLVLQRRAEATRR